MCIAILTPPGKKIKDEHFYNSWDANRDGCGMAHINEKGRIIIYKELEYEPFKAYYNDICEKYPDSPKIVHFRVMTHGHVSTDNCHPFRIDKDHVFAHNGTITPCAPSQKKAKGKSDTRIFNEDILCNLPDGWMFNEGIKALVEEFIGWSKLIFLRTDGSWDIFNEGLGEWEDGIWFSNDKYRTNPITYSGYYNRSDRYGNEYRVNNKRRRYDKWLHCSEQYDNEYKIWREVDQAGNYVYALADELGWNAQDHAVVDFSRVKEEKDRQADLDDALNKDFDRCQYCNVEFSTTLMRVKTYTSDKTNQLLNLCDYCYSHCQELKMGLEVINEEELDALMENLH